jgi:hypothetical protein
MSANQWIIDTCKKALVTFTKKAIPAESSISRWVGSSVQHFTKYVKLAASVMCRSSLVSSKDIDRLYKEAFRERDSMMLAKCNATRTAVTTYDAEDGSCSIITTYNRQLDDEPKSYKWYQGKDHHHLQVKFWEA